MHLGLVGWLVFGWKYWYRGTVHLVRTSGQVDACQSPGGLDWIVILGRLDCYPRRIGANMAAL